MNNEKKQNATEQTAPQPMPAVDSATAQERKTQAPPSAPPPVPRTQATEGSSPVSTRKLKRAGDAAAKRVAILGFSASGKTVFLSMLYHATAECRKFQEGWRADWSSGDEGATARYLRRVGHSILGLDDKGKKRFDSARTKLKRSFPEGTREINELRFVLTRTWGFVDFPLSIRTLEYSGEAIHRAFLNGVENLPPDYKEQWNQIEELCSQTDALLLFVNMLNVDMIQDSGEMLMVLQWILGQKRRPRAIAIVVTGADVLDDQKELDSKQQEIEKKYAVVLDTMENQGVAHKIFMVSSIGRNMVRKRTRNLDPACMGAEHLCPLCQELVDEPEAAPEPINMAAPIEYVFRRLLPWYMIWPPMAAAVGAMVRVKRAIFNRFVLPVLATGLLAWAGVAYWLDERETYLSFMEMINSKDLGSAYAIADTGNHYVSWHSWWKKREADNVRKELGIWLEFSDTLKMVNNSRLEPQPKLTRIKDFMLRYPDSRHSQKLTAFQPGLECQLDIMRIKTGGPLSERAAMAGEILAKWDNPALHSNVVVAVGELWGEIDWQQQRDLKALFDNPNQKDSDRLHKVMEDYRKNVEKWRIDDVTRQSYVARLAETDQKIHAKEAEVKERERDREFVAEINKAKASIREGKFKEASDKFELLRSSDPARHKAEVEAMFQACKTGVAFEDTVALLDWPKAEEQLKLLEASSDEAVSGAGKTCRIRFTQIKAEKEIADMKSSCVKTRDACYVKIFSADTNLLVKYARDDWNAMLKEYERVNETLAKEPDQEPYLAAKQRLDKCQKDYTNVVKTCDTIIVRAKDIRRKSDEEKSRRDALKAARNAYENELIGIKDDDMVTYARGPWNEAKKMVPPEDVEPEAGKARYEKALEKLKEAQRLKDANVRRQREARDDYDRKQRNFTDQWQAAPQAALRDQLEREYQSIEAMALSGSRLATRLSGESVEEEIRRLESGASQYEAARAALRAAIEKLAKIKELEKRY
ncbi:MAG: hypothetical protein C0404_01555 [Verrucomicrobia bacterium]|nr:hypothetical protein [Verrucomicrobiota bacterium]